MAKKLQVIFGVLVLATGGVFVGDSLLAPTLEQRLEKVTFSKPLECSSPTIAAEHRAFCKEVADVAIARAHLRGSLTDLKEVLADTFDSVQGVVINLEDTHRPRE